MSQESTARWTRDAKTGLPYDDGVRIGRGTPASTPGVDFETIVATLQRDVWLLCRHLTDRESADDLTQETFLRVYSALPNFRGDSSVKTWVLSIAQRACADEVRSLTRERKRQHRAREQLVTAATQLPDIGEGITLWSLVDRLDIDRRAAFVLTQVFGLSYEETAKICDCPIGTVRSRVARARTDLLYAQSATTDHLPKERRGRYTP
jgi:RNA polymerase sigma-70 factor (ECF subfamily)